MSRHTRRDFLRNSAFGLTAAPLLMTQQAGAAAAVPPSEKVRIGLIGCGGIGRVDLRTFFINPEVECPIICDVDEAQSVEAAKIVEGMRGNKPDIVKDFRRVIDRNDIDAVLVATPDHWHALPTVYACQAGKDVYVEKPTSHNIWESRKMVEAARKYGRIVQVGAQNRSAPYCHKAFDYIRSEAFGSVHFARVINSKERGAIGKKPDGEPPAGVDYDMWLGPAPNRPFNPNRFHYNWHWFWDFSGGDIINDGVHQMDIARWLIDKDYPKFVTSGGGKIFFDDDQECPDTHSVIYDFDGLTMVFEEVLWAPYMRKTPMEIRDLDTLPNWPFSGTRIEIYGSKQFMMLGRHGGGWEVFDADGKSVNVTHGEFTDANHGHIGNFIDCVRSRELPNADIEKVHLSTLLCHYGNIAYRTGRRLQIDPATEGFVNDDDANSYVKRTYREPYVVPEQV